MEDVQSGFDLNDSLVTYPVIIFATVLHPKSLRKIVGSGTMANAEIDSQQCFYVQVAGGLDNFKEKLLFTGNELCIPFTNDNLPTRVEVV